MRILFITDNYPPEHNAPAIRTFEHITEWSKSKDINISVITCFPNFPKGKIFKGYKNKLISVEYINGIKVYRVWSYIAENDGIFKRIIDFLSFAMLAFIFGIFIKTDILIATSPQFFTTWTAFFLSKIKRIPWIFELRDLWPESISSLNLIKNKFILNFLERIEIALYKDSNRIIAVTNSFKRNLILRGIDKNKIDIITNGVSYSNFKINKSFSPDIKIKDNLKNKFVIGYLGTLGLAQGLDFILRSLKQLDIENIHFLIVGEGAQKKYLVKLSMELKLNNITFIDSVNRNYLPQYYQLIDVSLVCLKKSDVFKTVIPSKIFESCAMQKPILLGVEGESKELVEKYKAGLAFSPEDYNDFHNKIKCFFNKDIYKIYQKGCKSLALEYRRDKLAKKMLAIIRKVYEENLISKY